MSMVEIVATAIAAENATITLEKTGTAVSWDVGPYHKRLARAALLAMRDNVTPGMVEAGAHAAHSELIGANNPREDWMDDEDWQEQLDSDRWPETNFYIGADRFRECSQAGLFAALDAALAEGGE